MARIAGVADRVAEVRRRISAAGGDGRVKLVAVSKGVEAPAVAEALAAGVIDLGENYAQELLAKVPALEGGETTARWHFIGQLQTNKVRALAPHVSVWQSVDRAPLVDELARRAPGAEVMVQVSVTGEVHRGGCAPMATAGLVSRCRLAGLHVTGLMAVGPQGAPEDARPGFRLLRRLADELGLPERSMGMTDDLEVAVDEGSTLVRVGRAIFGDRPHAGVQRSVTSPR
jgi:pyridoxal phosphate enzyme (YggS family)